MLCLVFQSDFYCLWVQTLAALLGLHVQYVIHYKKTILSDQLIQNEIKCKKKILSCSQKYGNKESLTKLLYVELALHFTVFDSTPLNSCLTLLRLLANEITSRHFKGNQMGVESITASCNANPTHRRFS